MWCGNLIGCIRCVLTMCLLLAGVVGAPYFLCHGAAGNAFGWFLAVVAVALWVQPVFELSWFSGILGVVILVVGYGLFVAGSNGRIAQYAEDQKLAIETLKVVQDSEVMRVAGSRNRSVPIELEMRLKEACGAHQWVTGPTRMTHGAIGVLMPSVLVLMDPVLPNWIRREPPIPNDCLRHRKEIEALDPSYFGAQAKAQ